MMEVDDLDAKHGTTMEVGPEPGADKDDAPTEPPRAAVPVDVETSSVADAEEMVVRAWDPAIMWAMVTWAMVVLGGAFLVFGIVTIPPAFPVFAQAALDKDFGTMDARMSAGFFGVFMFLSWVACLYALVGTVVSLLWRCAFGKWQGIDDFLRRGNSHVWEVLGYISLETVYTLILFAVGTGFLVLVQ